MRKVAMMILAVLILALPLGAYAGTPRDRPPQSADDESQPRPNSHKQQAPHNNGKPQHNDDKRQPDGVSLPFKWHEHRGNFAPDRHHLNPLEDRRWAERFDGMRPYKWHDGHGEGFLYHGHRVVDAIFFYDSGDRLVFIGFMRDGVFIMIHADGREVRNQDAALHDMAWRVLR